MQLALLVIAALLFTAGYFAGKSAIAAMNTRQAIADRSGELRVSISAACNISGIVILLIALFRWAF